MTNTKSNIFSQVELVAKDVIRNLKNKGYVVPTKENNGAIRFENYLVKKETSGFYSVLDVNGNTYVKGLNLPQTAAIIANSLALGKILDNNLIALDRDYGYKIFDRDLFKKNTQKKTSIDQFIYYKTQMDNAIVKAKYIKDAINRAFLKLYRLA
jgi:hypothetical protein